MEDKVKENLLKQVELLQQKSENASVEQLVALSAAMAALAKVFVDGSQSGSGVAGLNYQYVTPLPLEDSLALHAARVQRWNRQQENLQK